MASVFTKKDLQYFIDQNLNVLFSGRHGVGKTARVLDIWRENKIKYLYFSASTLDPFLDFVGIPKEHIDEDGHRYIDYIRPKPFEFDEVEAIFLDEYNRAHKKTSNACMELIQFGSINGKPLKNLRFVWAAINENAEDEQLYHVEPMDPAQLDRFEVHLEVPYEPDQQFFASKYGSEISIPAIEWWEALPEKAKEKVSPRRLEYALDVYTSRPKRGNISFVLPKEANPMDLVNRLSNGGYLIRINEMINRGDKEKEWADALEEDNFKNFIVKEILLKKNDKYSSYRDKMAYNYLMPNLHKDEQSEVVQALHLNRGIMKKLSLIPETQQVIQDIVKANAANEKTISVLKNYIQNISGTGLAALKAETKVDMVSVNPDVLNYYSRVSNDEMSTGAERFRVFALAQDGTYRKTVANSDDHDTVHSAIVLLIIRNRTARFSNFTGYSDFYPKLVDRFKKMLDGGIKSIKAGYDITLNRADLEQIYEKLQS